MKGGRPTQATIRLDALRANFAQARSAAAGRSVIAVVKADAYGHGALVVSRTLVAAGCERLATLTAAEALELREGGVAVPILLLGGVDDPDEAAAAVADGLTPVIHHRGQLELVAAAAAGVSEPLPVHVEVDTGMRRMGAPPDEAAELLAEVSRTPGLTLEGVYTQFSRADEPDLAPSLAQLSLLGRILEEAARLGVRPALIHCANSAGLLAGSPLVDALPGQGAVRPGLMLYGGRPAPHFSAALRPVMTLRTEVVHLRRVRAGESVGYGGAFQARSDTRVATLALGYADGVPVSAASGSSGSGGSQVLIRGRRMPVVGRVSMDFVGVDVGGEAVEIGDEVIVFGEGQGTSLPVEEAAAAAGTLSYELMVRVGSRVPRVVVDP